MRPASLSVVLACLALPILAAFAAGCGRTRLTIANDASVPEPDADIGCRSDIECDDGLFCNGAERCASGRCVAGRPPSCDDGVGCTTDTCEGRSDSCRSTPDSSLCFVGEICDPMRGCIVRPCMFDDECDDGLICNGREICLGGICSPTMPPFCNDGIECTDDVCDDAAGCVFFPRDRDLDGFGDALCGGDDCDDTQPGIFPGAPEECENGLDDDCNARVDCDDPRCAMTRVCMCLPVEECGSGIDADCDGRFGCDDPDCRGLPICMMPCTPRELGSAVGMGVASGDTSGGPNDVTPSCATSRAPEHIYRWTAPASGTWTFDTIGSGYDTMLVILRTCTGPELACNDDTPGFGTASRVQVSLMSGETVLIVIDGWATSAGMYTLNIQMGGGMEICDNGADDDGDRLIDCADVDCSMAPSCCRPRAEACTNMVDDDCDRLIDCADPDCRRSPSCCIPTTEVCTDGRDQDCDRLIDCADPDCATAPACCIATAEVCTDGRDQDCDGRIDCADADCASHPACCVASPEVCDNMRDDDCDSSTDCSDSDCRASPVCCVPTPEVCTGGRDEDCDRRIDCADTDCASNPACCVPSPEICDNMRDDDCDGLPDCLDPVCAASPVCCVPRPEICDNGRDDDCDRAIDCGDSNCDSSPICCTPVPEVCSNMEDDDCDGRTDCADTECALHPACCTPAPEICDDGADQDCDARVDCADPDCATSPVCVPCPDADLGSRLGLRVAAGTTSGAPNRFTPSCAMSSAGDRAFIWTAPVTSDYLFDTFGSTFDTVIAVRTGCSGSELPGACNNDVPALGTIRSRVRVTLTAGTRVLIVVDGNGSSSGSFVLNITRVVSDEAGLCTDRLDNDGDFQFDCLDPDCAMDTACGG